MSIRLYYPHYAHGGLVIYYDVINYESVRGREVTELRTLLEREIRYTYALYVQIYIGSESTIPFVRRALSRVN